MAQAKVESELKTAAENLAAAKSTIEEKDKEVAAQKAEVDVVNKSLAEAKKNEGEKKAELDQANEKLTALTTKLGAGDPEALLIKVKELETDKDEAKKKLSEAIQEKEVLELQKRASDEKLAATEKTVKEYKEGVSKVGLSGKVVSYDKDWSFVVVNLGDKQGLKANTPLLVTRAGQVIGKLKVTRVGAATSVADVLPGLRGELAKGDGVMVEASL